VQRAVSDVILPRQPPLLEPRILSWTGVSVRFCSFLARRDDDAGFTLLGGATLPGSCKSVQSHP